MNRFLASSVLFVSLIYISGCGTAPPPPVEVTGVVYYSEHAEEADPEVRNTEAMIGKPISGAKVTFHDQGLPIGYGITDGLGRFRIRSYHRTNEPVDGLPRGFYAVTITKLSLVEKSPSDLGTDLATDAEQLLPALYSDPRTTKWQAIEVKYGENRVNHFRLAVRQ